MINHDAWLSAPDPVPTAEKYFFSNLGNFELRDDFDTINLHINKTLKLLSYCSLQYI